MRQMQPADGKRLDVKRAEESSLGDHLERGLLKTARAKDGRGSRTPSPGTARVASGLWLWAPRLDQESLRARDGGVSGRPLVATRYCRF